jgi:hypothetical protein
VDLQLSSPQVDSPCLGRRDALDGLTVVATLAYELCWTYDCVEDPLMHGQLPMPVSLQSCGHVLTAASISACVLLSIPQEVAFVSRCLCQAHPLGVAHRLQSACGVASCYCPPRPSTPRTPRLCFYSRIQLTLKAGGALASRAQKLSSFGKNDSSSADAPCGGRRWLVDDGVLPG